MASRTPLFAAILLAILLAVPAAGPESSTPPTTTVTVVDETGEHLGTVAVDVADTPVERYTGLSDATSLGPNEGMLFVYDDEARRTFVMRDMTFPIDVVFVDGNRSITAIHHAPVETDRPLTPYRGRARWVLEVPYNWTTAHDVAVGDHVRIDTANGTTLRQSSPNAISERAPIGHRPRPRSHLFPSWV